MALRMTGITPVGTIKAGRKEALIKAIQGVEQGKLMASDGYAGDWFGSSVSISSDGNTAIVGAYGEETKGSNAGAAYVFTRSGSTWTEQAKLIASDGDDLDYFGRSVSISSDGNTAIVGAGGNDTKGNYAGAAYIFTRSGSTWIQQQKLFGNDTVYQNQFGVSVSISSDGNTVIVGADRNNGRVGAAYIFTRLGSTWTEQQKLTASDGEAFDEFGRSVSISSDGNTAIVGAHYEDTNGDNAGAAYIFTRSGSTWTEQAKLMASDGQKDDLFGVSVSISSDGETAIIGACYEDTNGAYSGVVYIFTRSGSTWTEQQKIMAGDGEANDRFGRSVSISSDGSTAIIGAYNEDTKGSDAGAAYIFV